MNILVIDTATEACSVALQYQGKSYQQFEICPQQHSQRLLPMVDDVLKQAGVKLQQLDYLGFGRGPGSFTGVRIATGMIQGLALGTDLPVIGISTMATMAQQKLQQTTAKHVAVAIDARMDEVYFGLYAETDGVMSALIEEQVLPPEQALAVMAEFEHSFELVGTGWQAYESLSALINTDVDVLYPCAEYMLPLAEAIKEQAVAVEDIQPVYLRDKVTWKKLPGRE